MAKLAKILFIPVHGREPTTDQRVDPSQQERHGRWVVVALMLGALGLFWAGAYLYQQDEATGLQTLPADARRNLYARTLDEIQTLCRAPAAGSGSLRDHCVAQAHFVLRLPECADACQRAAALVLPHARR